MFKFNSNHILTGQIKQILNSFNLPSYKIYTPQHYKYYLESLALKGTKDERPLESPELRDGLYIKWDRIYEYKNGQWGKELDTYGYNNKYLNFTKTFPIANNVYDSDTHEYLGEFLRFQRDYLGVDLMPLYNCFSNRVCSNLSINIYGKYPDTYEEDPNEVETVIIPEVRDKLDKEKILVEAYTYQTKKLTKVPGKEYKLRRAFWTKDKDYVIYMIPIKFFKQYTIALDCTTGVEMCCGLYDNYLEELDDKRTFVGGQNDLPSVEMSQYLANATYKKYSNLRFNNPELWEGITYDLFKDVVQKCVDTKTPTGSSFTEEEKFAGYKQRLLERENILKLFIKIPVSQKTSITILEGNYIEFNNSKYGPELTKVPYVYLVPKFDENGNAVKDENGEQILERVTEIRDEVIWKKYQNRFITNYETYTYGEDDTSPDAVLRIDLPELEDRPFEPISPLQLLMFNTKESYPFSDRLIEYLSGNVITPWDENVDNIKRAQKVLQLNNNKIEMPGAWDDTMRRMFYDYMMNGKPTGDQFTFDINHDTLGYVDKDVEKFYTAWAHEYCRDKLGYKIPLTEKIKDENGNYVLDDQKRPKERQLYRLVKSLLTDSQKKLLLERRKFLLTVKDEGAVPMYKQRFVPQGTISSIDIYEEED